MRKIIFTLFLISTTIPHTLQAAPTCNKEATKQSDCNAGCYWDPQSSSCTECPAGSKSSNGSAQCTKCNPGEYSNTNRTKCEKCATLPSNNPHGTLEYNTPADAANAYSCNGTITCDKGYHPVTWIVNIYRPTIQCDLCPTDSYTTGETKETLPNILVNQRTCTNKCEPLKNQTTNEERTGCVCKDNYTNVNEGNPDKKELDCQPNVYTIKLDLNYNTDPKTTTIYYKYGIGYSTTPESTNWSTDTPGFTLPKRWGYEFNGYYKTKYPTQADQVFNEQGKATDDYKGNATSAKSYFNNNDKILYAGWQAGQYTIKYDTIEEPQTCTFGQSCLAAHIEIEANSGEIGTWNCKISQRTFEQQPNKPIPEPTEGEGNYITCTKHIYKCPVGYYCSNGTKTACPAGTSTRGEGKTQKTDCGIILGDAGTQFCDNSGECFTLKGIGIIPALTK